MKPADPGHTTQAATGGQGYAAANDDHGPAPAVTTTRDARTKDAGWDPFEVWRTRVRDARRGWPGDAEG